MPSSSNSRYKSGAQLIIATAILKSSYKYTNKSRTKLLKNIISKLKSSADVVLLPAGYYRVYGKADKIYKYAIGSIKSMLVKSRSKIIVCFGVDGVVGDETPDQIALAVSRKGLIARGRKFYPTNDEDIRAAIDYKVKEDGYPRVFEIKGKKIFMAVCYDAFGIKKQKISNPGINLIFDLIHRFTPPPKQASSENYFARHGLAGAAMQWHVPVFGSVVFFNRSIPEKWPSGIVWNRGNMPTKCWKYRYNPLMYYDKLSVSGENGAEALIRIFKLDSKWAKGKI